MMLNKKNILAFSSILFVLLLSVLIYSFFSDFGLRDDEGFYLYYLKQGIAEPTFTFFHTLGNLFGFIFSYQLLGFRLLNLLLLIISVNLSIVFGYQFYFNSKKLKDLDFYLILSFVNISTLGFFSFIPTFSYTSSATIACFLWSSVIFYISKNGREEDSCYYTLLVLTFLFAICSRVQLFVVLLGTLPFILFFINRFINKDSNLSIFKSLLAVSIFTFIFLAFHLHFLTEILPIGKIIYETTHDSLLLFYLSNLSYLIFHQDFYVIYISILLISFYLLLKFKFKKDLSVSILITLILILIIKDIYGFSKSFLDIAGTPSNYSNRALRYFFILTIFTPILIGYFNFLKSKLLLKRHKFDKKFIFLFLISVLGCFFSSVGNNSNLVLWASFTIGLSSIPFFFSLTLFKNPNSLRLISLVCLLAFIVNLSIIYREQIYQFRRSPIKSSNFKVSSSPFLRNIKIDPYSADVIDNFLLTLKDINFNYKSDRIFSYPELPGLLASSKAISLGDAHNQHLFSKKQFRELKSIETKICAFLIYENLDKVENVYILQGEGMSQVVENCLFKIIDDKSNVKTYKLGELINIGMAYNDYSTYMTEIKLKGPYKLIAK
ncbi:hypothetical protein HN460_00300 [bacterium]|nr:hypothetical protein [bacterium]MBT3795341.1 hypothetical protein [bacterium]